MSQRDMALKLNIGPRNYARLERGERKQLDLQLIGAIADALDVDLSTLLEPLFPPDKPGRSQPDPVGSSVEKHYETVIAQLMEVVENQKIIIEKKNQILQQFRLDQSGGGYGGPDQINSNGR